MEGYVTLDQMQQSVVIVVVVSRFHGSCMSIVREATPGGEIHLLIVSVSVNHL